MSQENPLTQCPRCGQPSEAGFCLRNSGVSFVTPEKVLKRISRGEDLAEAGIRKFLPAKAEYFRSHLCRDCEVYVIDFSMTLSHQEAQEVANGMV